MRNFLIISFLLFSQICNAQFVDKIHFFIPPAKSSSEEPVSKSFTLHKPISSLSLGIKPEHIFDDSYVIAGRDTFYLKHDEHGFEDESKFSVLVIFPQAVSSFQLHYASLRDSIDIFIINDKLEHEVSSELFGHTSLSNTSTFEMPAMIEQSFWRAGLKSPDFERIVHDVHNVIVHHSASSNLVTDYRSAVRNIYLYHTEVRGWSDIGYNYVVVANGDIYKGRDPGVYEQDLVMGAHFCSSNRGTMGICMLGTYTDIAPTDTAFASLEKLLVWKLGKDNMDALGYYAHPLNEELDVISGHRDGCATECPGEVLYSRLGLLRERVHNKIILTGIELISNIDDQKNEIHLFPNPIEKCISITSPQKIESISIITSSGQIVTTIKNPSAEIDLSFLPAGMFFLEIFSGDKTYTKRILKK